MMAVVAGPSQALDLPALVPFARSPLPSGQVQRFAGHWATVEEGPGLDLTPVADGVLMMYVMEIRTPVYLTQHDGLVVASLSISDYVDPVTGRKAVTDAGGLSPMPCYVPFIVTLPDATHLRIRQIDGDRTIAANRDLPADPDVSAECRVLRIFGLSAADQ